MSSWYDRFASFYDASVESVYAPYRARMADALDLSPGDAVLDLPCGTGPNLPHLADAVGPDGRVVGVDLSPGMLAKAAHVADALPEGVVRLHEGDATALDAGLAASVGRPDGFDAVLVSLGLTVFPDWEAVFANTFDLLAPGGRYVIFDIHADRWVPQTCIVALMAQADMRREVWAPLHAVADDPTLTFLEGSRHVHGGRPFLATGRRP